MVAGEKPLTRIVDDDGNVASIVDGALVIEASVGKVAPYVTHALLEQILGTLKDIKTQLGSLSGLDPE